MFRVNNLLTGREIVVAKTILSELKVPVVKCISVKRVRTVGGPTFHIHMCNGKWSSTNFWKYDLSHQPSAMVNVHHELSGSTQSRIHPLQ